jgi:thiol:disulfide interchange protein DsbD
MRLSGKIKRLCIFLALAALPFGVAGQTATSRNEFNTAAVQAPHLSVQLVTARDVIHPGDSLQAGLYFKLDKGWHVYWSNAGDSGEPPRIRWTLPEGITADAMQFPVPQRLPLGPLMDYGYEGEVVFPILLHAAESLKPEANLEASAKVDWLVCREVCIPGKAELKLPISVAGAGTPGKVLAQGLIQSWQQRLPQPLPPEAKATFASTPSGFSVFLDTGRSETSAQFFPFDESQIDNPAKQQIKPLRNGLQIELKKDENLKGSLATLHGLVVFPDGRAFDVQFQPGRVAGGEAASPTGFGQMLRIAGLAFLGGVILNLMPCVFPVLFIKGLALVQSSGEERSRMKLHGLVYTLGIVASFWAVVAVLLALRAGGRQFGWGFQFQSPAFVAVMALLLFFLALSLAGMFEIGLTLTSAGSGLASRQGYAGSFFTGVLAMVVATPCTAPFMGAAIGFALAQSAIVTFAIFTALAVGLAAPYLLLSFNPAWTRLLPRPGAWMEVLKQATAVPIFATVIWLVWLFAQSAGVNALLGLLGGFLLLAIAGWVLGRWPAKSVASAVAALVGILAVALPIYAAQKYGSVAETVANTASAKGPSTWEPFTPQLVEGYRAQGKPVLVDFTASWCLSCQVNERVVLDRDDVQKRLRDSGIALVRADWTRHDETIAQTLAGLGRSGVPTYVLYSGTAGEQPKILPEVLTTGIIFDALDGLKQGSTQSGQADLSANK